MKHGEIQTKIKMQKKLSVAQFLALGYLITIVIGTILLLMPFATKSGEGTSFVDAFFTATSATCVTGLVPFDTFLHWNLFGQIVILCLIQIGGLGFMTIITLIFMMFKKNIGLYNRTILMQSAGSYTISGVVKLIKRIILGTFIFEALGAIVLSFAFWGEFGLASIYYGIFHSVSAFCNAGFDLLGSLSAYSNNALVLITLMALIIIGGLGFIVWSDILDCKFKFKKFQLHTKIVLIFNLVLIVVPAILFFVFETFNINSTVFDEMGIGEKILNSFFMSVSPRTAGFNTVNVSSITTSSKFLTMILMFIGGSSGSTAGGIKLTTFVVVIMNLFAQVKGQKSLVMFNRKISDKVVKQASSLVLAYLIVIILSTLIIGSYEPFGFENILFEVMSAIGTVGLSVGVSQSASVVTKLILILLMFIGRLGAFTLFETFVKEKKQSSLEEVEGKILVG